MTWGFRPGTQGKQPDPEHFGPLKIQIFARVFLQLFQFVRASNVGLSATRIGDFGASHTAAGSLAGTVF
jgi:hypothetical protein